MNAEEKGSFCNLALNIYKISAWEFRYQVNILKNITLEFTVRKSHMTMENS